MNRIMLIAVVCCIPISSLKAQEKLTDSHKEVQNTVIKLFDALSNRDSASLASYCTADILLFENGAIWNLDTLIAKAIRLNRAKDFKRVNTIHFINTNVDREMAWTTYNNRADIIQNGNHRSMQWMETVILIKEGSIWKIKVLHSTLIKRN
jgi:ketosteroid isomerase-like protein